jgi:predicted ArsR family transcriptional regulator
MNQFINEFQSYRFQILAEMYKRSNADIDFVLDVQKIAEQLGIHNRNFQSVFKYLYMEEFIQVRAMNQQGGESYQASIKHKGIRAVEEVFQNPNRATDYFPSYREMMY